MQAQDARRHGAAPWPVLVLLAWGAGLGCGGSVSGNVNPDASLSPDVSFVSDASEEDDDAGIVFHSGIPDSGSASCPAGSPLSCYVDNDCSTPTTITGTVYDPAGRNPVYRAVVFVPNVPNELPAITGGNPSCDTCDIQIGDYVTVTLTDATGHFKLVGVPTGSNVPLVVQTGKWRRLVTVPVTSDCATTTLAAGTLRLPRNRKEGDLPQMALLTGGCDNLACFLRSVGVDASEFSSPHAGGRVDVYQGLGATGAGAPLSSGTAGDCTTDGCPLWSSTASLAAYDSVLLGCECGENNQTKPAASLTAMHDYLAQGGTVFATHSQATWFKNGPADFQGVANWTDGPASGATGPFAVDTSYPGGNGLRNWLAGIDAGDRAGVVPLVPADVSTSVTTVNLQTASRWIYDESPVPDGGGAISGNVKALSFNGSRGLPDAGESVNHCGSAYFTDIHAAGGQAVQDTTGDAAAVPAACDGGPMTPEEKALEYLFFYQPSCQPQPVKGPPPL